MRQAHKVAGDLKVDFKELKDAAKRLGIGQKGKNLGKDRMLTYEEIDKLEAELGVNVKLKEPTKYEKPLGPMGSFIGVVFNPEVSRYEIHTVRLRRENLGMYETKLIKDCATIYGAMVEFDKFKGKAINDKLVAKKVEDE